MKILYPFLTTAISAKQLRHLAAMTVILCFAMLLPVKLFAQAPVISTFSPIKGPVGTPVTITGTGFNTTAANNIVFFGATRATVTAASATSLSVTVPSGATYGSITVLNTGTTLAAYSSKFFLPTFTPKKGSINATDFDPKMDFTTGSTSVSLTIGDIDGDGKSDLIIANENGTISVLRNTGSSGNLNFAAKVDIAAKGFPFSVALGDLDGDGKPDLAVVDNNSGTVSVLLNTSSPGSVSFAAKVDLPTGALSRSVAIGDIDGDGKPDLVIADEIGNAVVVLLNTSSPGSVSFAAKKSVTTGARPFSVAVGDLNGDGKPDVVVACFGDNTISLLQNTSVPGSISFAARTDFPAGNGPDFVRIGDIDGDGRPDLVVADYGDNAVSVLLNTGSPGGISFAANVEFSTGAQPFSLAIGDIDGDGQPDLVTANVASNNVSVLRNTCGPGTVSFAAKVGIPVEKKQPYSIAIGDLDGDGSPDLAVAKIGINTVSVMRYDPFPATPVITSFTPDSGEIGTAVTITGTGFNTTAANNIVFFGATRAEVKAASPTSLTVTVPTGATYGAITTLNAGNSLVAYSSQFFMPIFTPHKSTITAADFGTKVTFTTGPRPEAVAIADIDGDGKPDLVIANFNTYTISVLRATGSPGNFRFAPKADFTVGSLPVCLAVGDIDGDGKPDLVIGYQYDKTVSLLLNTSGPGKISFAAKVDLTTGSDTRFVAICDFDGDGKPDVAIPGASNNTVSVLRNTGRPGNISFAAAIDITTAVGPSGIAIGDMDGDGKPDLVTSNQSSSSVSVLRNTGSAGNISFATKADFAVPSPVCLAIGDIDGDGKPDIVAGTGYNNVSVLRNTGSSGNISFAAKIDFAAGSINSIGIGDINGDGKPDVVSVNGTSTTLMRNTGSPGSISFDANLVLQTGSEKVAIGDVDGDGKPDLIGTNDISANYVWVLPNMPVFAPTIQATNISFKNKTSTTVTANWTNGNGISRAVFMRAGSTGMPAPADFTNYTANTAFGAGDQIGSTGWYCVYNGTRSTATINGLTPGSTYSVMALEYNSNGSYPVWLTTAGTGNPSNITMPSTRAALSSLTISNGTLSPAFDSLKTSYTATATSAFITVTPVVSYATATITVNGTAVLSGNTSAQIPLNPGVNTVNIVVTSADGTATKTYTITITKAASGYAMLSMALSTGSDLTYVSSSNQVNYYSASVTPGTVSLTLTPTASDPGATITVNGSPVASGTASQSIAINANPTIITAVLTAADGVTKRTYAVSVYKNGSSDVSLQMTLSSGSTLTYVSGANHEAYFYASVSPGTASLTLAPTATDPNATIVVDGLPVTSGTASQSIALNTNPTIITVQVTAEDGVTQRTYALSVYKNGSSNAILSGLTLSTGSDLTFVSTSNQVNTYSASVTPGANALTVSPTASDPGATITVNGSPVVSGSASQLIAINANPTVIPVEVTAADGITKRTTLLFVYKNGSSDVSLSMYISRGSNLTYVSGANHVSYFSGSVAAGTTSTSLTAISTNPGASITVNGMPVTSGVPSQSIALNTDPTIITVQVTAQDGVTSRTYSISVTHTAAADNSLYISVSKPTDGPQLMGGELTVHQGISPNGDGINDFLLIEGITAYPDNKLTIMNRAGQVIFEAKSYDNSTKVFDGHSTKTGAMQLPGTYFYSLDYSVKGVAVHKTGYIVLKY